ncbi:cytochrome c oxidase subunit 4 [Paenibacillus sp. UNCCL117]|nr:cytochrome c oxidase subunit 4 [Paenibacillus sp. cl123]SFW59882.1 cytochrome c oxidase subunit 4 [Paenibacillus sp. UNCCL117]
MGLLNLGSLLLGLLAWILPVFNLWLYTTSDKRRDGAVLAVLSLSCCAVSLCLQMLYTAHLIKHEDWSALLDITDAVVSAAAALLIVTLVLNAVTLIVYRRRSAKQGVASPGS